MKKLAFILIVIVLCISCIKKVQNTKPDSSFRDSFMRDSSFFYHFRILDSMSSLVRNDTDVYCCAGSISFMERKTKIEASSSGTFFGKLYFTKSDLRKWHLWYEKMYLVK